MSLNRPRNPFGIHIENPLAPGLSLYESKQVEKPAILYEAELICFLNLYFRSGILPILVGCLSKDEQ
jgi:hypothetical protein